MVLSETSRLKVGFVLDDSLDRPDGVQQYVLTTGEWLRSHGHDVHYLVSTTLRRDLPNMHDLGENIGVSFNGNMMHTPLPASQRRIRALLAREQFDILHVQMPYSPLLAGRIIKAAGPKTAVVGTFHIVPKSRLVSVAVRMLAVWCTRTLSRFDAVMSVSSAAQAFAQKAFGLSSLVVPNAIWLDTFRAAKPYARKHPEVINILFLGRLVPRKGCLLLLQAVMLLKDDPAVPPFAVTVCGKGPLEQELQAFVARNGLERYVTFKGFVREEDKPRYYASADVTVFPSNGGESFGIVLIEAMASGRSAVLAGDNSGYRTVLDACPGDVLFDPRSPAALAETLKTMLTDKALRRHIASWQRHHAEQFDIERTGGIIVRTYISALRQRTNMR